jgi:hypothetical protein
LALLPLAVHFVDQKSVTKAKLGDVCCISNALLVSAIDPEVKRLSLSPVAYFELLP